MLHEPPIVSCARRGDLDGVEDLVEDVRRDEKRGVVNAAGHLGGLHFDTALHAAAKAGRAEVVRYLLSDCLADPTLECYSSSSGEGAAAGASGCAATPLDVACTELGAAGVFPADPSQLALFARVGDRAPIGSGLQTDYGGMAPRECARSVLTRAAEAAATVALLTAAAPFWSRTAASAHDAGSRDYGAPPEFRALRCALGAVRVASPDAAAIEALTSTIARLRETNAVAPRDPAALDHDGFLATFRIGDPVQVLGLKSASGSQWNGSVGRVVQLATTEAGGRYGLEMLSMEGTHPVVVRGGAKLIKPRCMRQLGSVDRSRFALLASASQERARAPAPARTTRSVRFASATSSSSSASLAAAAYDGVDDEPEEVELQHIASSRPVRALDELLRSSRIKAAQRGAECGCSSFMCLNDQLDWDRLGAEGVDPEQWAEVRTEACETVLERVAPLVNVSYLTLTETPRERREAMAEQLGPEAETKWRRPDSAPERDDVAELAAFHAKRLARLVALRAANTDAENDELREVSRTYGLFQQGSLSGEWMDDSIGAALLNLDAMQRNDGMGDPAARDHPRARAMSPAVRLKALLDAELAKQEARGGVPRRSGCGHSRGSGDEDAVAAAASAAATKVLTIEEDGAWGGADLDAIFDDLAAQVEAVSLGDVFASTRWDDAPDLHGAQPAPVDESLLYSELGLELELKLQPESAGGGGGGGDGASGGDDAMDVEGHAVGGGGGKVGSSARVAAIAAAEEQRRSTLAGLYAPARSRAHAAQVSQLD